MTTSSPKNPGASVRQRLLNHAKAHNQDFQRILTRYAVERLLFRLSQIAETRDIFILKGAMLFVTWPKQAFRPTGDLDLLGHGDPDPAEIKRLFTLVCQVEVPPDGMVFDAATLRVDPAREDEEYQGVTLSLKGLLSGAAIPIRVDIGFGDHVHPVPSRSRFPGLLPDFPPAEILMYPPETVLAEKFEAMVRFGEANGRLKDFYDIWVISRTFPLRQDQVVEAITATFRRRGTALPSDIPVALTPEFASRRENDGMWSGFLRRTPPTHQPPPFSELVTELQWFFEPLLITLAMPGSAQGQWYPDLGAWRSEMSPGRGRRQ